MKCMKCSEKAIFLNPNLCKNHFIAYFEAKVKKTINKYNLIKKEDKVVIACSGGKDSTSALYLINKFFGNAEALAIDEGIKGYRNNTLSDLKKFCNENSIKLKIISFEEKFGKTLDKMLNGEKKHPCTTCGILRRHLLNRYSKKYSKIATGHNLDDEAQSIIMNLLKNNIPLSARLGPRTGIVEYKDFTTRVKPLYFCTEKEVAAYTLLKGFDVKFTECPHIKNAFRAEVRDMLNRYESKVHGTKRKIIASFLKMLPKIKNHYLSAKKPVACKKCREPSFDSVCNACLTFNKIKNFK